MFLGRHKSYWERIGVTLWLLMVFISLLSLPILFTWVDLTTPYRVYTIVPNGELSFLCASHGKPSRDGYAWRVRCDEGDIYTNDNIQTILDREAR